MFDLIQIYRTIDTPSVLSIRRHCFCEIIDRCLIRLILIDVNLLNAFTVTSAIR